MKRVHSAWVLFFSAGLMAQTSLSRVMHTYSIVAWDSSAGELGVAVQSHWFSVGSVVTWAEAGVGAVATQSFVNPAFGPEGLRLLREGLSPEKAVSRLIAEDEGRDLRQLAMVDAQGRVAAFTGKRCIPEAGHWVGKGYSVQANLMRNASVWPAMARAFESARGPLAERLVAALEAAEGEGGDLRGRQSAALLVVRAKATGKPWEDRLVDLRVEDHPNPVEELRRLLTIHRAYEAMNAGDAALERGDLPRALASYAQAETMYPDNPEMRYWHAVTLMNGGHTDVAIPLFRVLFRQDSSWRILTQRLVGVGLLQGTSEVLSRVFSE